MTYFNMTTQEYDAYIRQKAPKSSIVKDTVLAFIIGGIICCIGQVLMLMFEMWLDKETAGTLVSVTLVFIGALLTGLGVYDDIAKYGGAGTLVPITGFANAMVAPALEFKTEGFVTGTAAKMFIIAGPVVVYGVAASIIYGIILVVFGLA